MKDLPWIAVYTGLRDHPKTGQLADALGVDGSYALGLLVTLWLYVGKHCADTGAVHGMSEDRLQKIFDTKLLVVDIFDAMSELDLIKIDRRGTLSIEIHDWDDYQGPAQKCLEDRVKDRDRKRAARAMSADSPGTVQGKSSATVQYSTVQERERDKKEKTDSPSTSSTPTDSTENLTDLTNEEETMRSEARNLRSGFWEMVQGSAGLGSNKVLPEAICVALRAHGVDLVRKAIRLYVTEWKLTDSPPRGFSSFCDEALPGYLDMARSQEAQQIATAPVILEDLIKVNERKIEEGGWAVGDEVEWRETSRDPWWPGEIVELESGELGLTIPDLAKHVNEPMRLAEVLHEVRRAE